MLPWLVAIIGLVVPMVGSGFVGWPFVVGWLVVLGLLWYVQPLGGASPGTKRIVAIACLPLLVAAAFEGGLYLIPAVVVWLIIDIADPHERRRSG